MKRRPATRVSVGGVVLPPPDHNRGPPLDDDEEHIPPWGRGGIRRYVAWKASHQQVWKVSPETALRRLRRARACGVTYEEYTAVLLDTGRYLQPGDTDLIAQIIARRPIRD